MSEPIRLGVVALPDAASVEVRQYGADGAVCRQTIHLAAELLAVDGKVADTVREAVEHPGVAYSLQTVPRPRKCKRATPALPAIKLTGETVWRRIGGKLYEVPATT